MGLPAAASARTPSRYAGNDGAQPSSSFALSLEGRAAEVRNAYRYGPMILMNHSGTVIGFGVPNVAARNRTCALIVDDVVGLARPAAFQGRDDGGAGIREVGPGQQPGGTIGHDGERALV